MVAIYKPYDVSTQLFYPWLIFYGAVGIPALVTASVLLAVNLGKSTDIYILQGDHGGFVQTLYSEPVF